MRAATSSTISSAAPDGWSIDLELRRFDLATGRFASVFKRRVQTSRGSAGIRLEAPG